MESYSEKKHIPWNDYATIKKKKVFLCRIFWECYSLAVPMNKPPLLGAMVMNCLVPASVLPGTSQKLKRVGFASLKLLSKHRRFC